MIFQIFENIRRKHPVIACITNYVTVNDVANVILASGGSPIMSDAEEEAADLIGIAHGLLINIGSITASSLSCALKAGKCANLRGIPVLLDPVGVGASKFRQEAIQKIFGEVKIAIIKGNLSEMRHLSGNSSGVSRGVDANPEDAIATNKMAAFAKNLSQKVKTTVVITGKTDFISDGTRCAAIFNGNDNMPSITGTGCQLGGLMTASLAAIPDKPYEVAISSTGAFGIAGEIGWSRMQVGDGNATYRNRIIDAISHINAKTLKTFIKLQEF